MLIDFHTHVFPDRIASSAISSLEARANIKACTDGTVEGLLKLMDQEGVDISVVLPVVTSPKQFESITRFSAEQTNERLVFFGGIHPDCEDAEAKMDKLYAMGFKGIKLHPDYQSTFINDEKYIRIIRRALEHGMYVSIHAGVDVGMPYPVHCPPDLAAQMLNAVDDLNRGEPRIILAHMGAAEMPQEVLLHLCTKNIYLDTGYTIDKEDPAVMKKIIRSHGAQRILFATDAPWNDPTSCVNALKKLELTPDEEELIFFKNAQRILGL